MIVKFFATLRKITKEKETIVWGPGEILGLLFELSDKYGKDMRKKLLTDKDELHPDLIILVNGRHIEHLDGVETKITDSDEIGLYPRIAGG